MNQKLSKTELIELVKKIYDPESSDDILEKNVSHPAPSDLIFWSGEDLSPEEIVERALAYDKNQ
ncbi:hypothetical protein NIE88_19965 [Sporolactobacillus shoreicorticis]|uniref:Uncharacterized protein n=1 Tax=Sporolactobacillus shoreicorticis TaxID=1923877 RepID=A0ABW5S1H5_9BACL|nr:hypothetical protein [Sporolactobacillus shoreicorticis]MCO7128022.1 hypothetical protein [Sporolactobacillus shoreicorticis]